MSNITRHTSCSRGGTGSRGPVLLFALLLAAGCLALGTPVQAQNAAGPGGVYSTDVADMLHAWFKADALASTLSDGDEVTTWPESSANGYDAVEVSPGQNPVFGAAAGPNGRPAVRFGLTTATALKTDLDPNTTITEATVFVVTNLNAAHPALGHYDELTKFMDLAYALNPSTALDPGVTPMGANPSSALVFPYGPGATLAIEGEVPGPASGLPFTESTNTSVSNAPVTATVSTSETLPTTGTLTSTTATTTWTGPISSDTTGPTSAASVSDKTRTVVETTTTVDEWTVIETTVTTWTHPTTGTIVLVDDEWTTNVQTTTFKRTTTSDWAIAKGIVDLDAGELRTYLNGPMNEIGRAHV